MMDDRCRYCHEPATTDMPLISPCTCKGSLACVHAACLEQWVYAKAGHRRDDQESYTSALYDNAICELCHTPYATRSAPARRIMAQGCQKVMHDASSSPTFHAAVNMSALALLSLFPWSCQAVLSATALLLSSLGSFACLCYRVSVGTTFLQPHQLDTVVFLKNVYFVFFCNGATLIFFVAWLLQWIWMTEDFHGVCVPCTMCMLPVYGVLTVILATRIRLHDDDAGMQRCMTYLTYLYESTEESCPLRDFNIRSCCMGKYVAHGQVLILLVRASLPSSMNLDAMCGFIWAIFLISLVAFLIIRGNEARDVLTPSHLRSDVVAQCLWFSVTASQLSLLVCWRHVFSHQDPPWQSDPFPFVWMCIWSVQVALLCSAQLILYSSQWRSFTESVWKHVVKSFLYREFASRESAAAQEADVSALHQALIQEED